MQRDDTRNPVFPSTDDFDPMAIARFWSRVDAPSDFQCWEWQGRKNPRGYGRVRRTMAHRVAYRLVNGPIPDDLLVRHRCDNPSCCNPLHLEVGTHTDNMQDAVERNRLATGARSGRTKLTEEQALYIQRNPDGKKQKELAAQFGVAASTVSYIRRGRSWSRLPMAPATFSTGET